MCRCSPSSFIALHLQALVGSQALLSTKTSPPTRLPYPNPCPEPPGLETSPRINPNPSCLQPPAATGPACTRGSRAARALPHLIPQAFCHPPDSPFGAAVCRVPSKPCTGQSSGMQGPHNESASKTCTTCMSNPNFSGYPYALYPSSWEDWLRTLHNLLQWRRGLA